MNEFGKLSNFGHLVLENIYQSKGQQTLLDLLPPSIRLKTYHLITTFSVEFCLTKSDLGKRLKQVIR